MAAGYWFFKTKAKHSMGTQYHQLTPEERYQIQALNRCDYSARRIAQILGRSNKTISRELNRVKGQPYAASKANKDAPYHRHHSTKYRKYTEVVIAHIDHFLGWGLSPEQIAGRMRLEGF